jgi:hypothetical protein
MLAGSLFSKRIFSELTHHRSAGQTLIALTRHRDEGLSLIALTRYRIRGQTPMLRGSVCIFCRCRRSMGRCGLCLLF